MNAAIPLDEPTRPPQDRAAAPAADVAYALSLGDLEQAAREGLISAQQAQALWRHLGATAAALPSSAQRTAAAAPPPHGGAPRFSFANVLYSFGGLLAIGAMTLFMTMGFQMLGPGALLVLGVAYLVGALKVAGHLKARGLPVPAGLLAALAVFLVPLIVWSIQSLLGLWPPGGPDDLRAYHTRVDWRWLTLELATLAAGAVMLWHMRLPFMVLPLALTLWYMSMDVASLLTATEPFDGPLWRDVSLVFGIATLGAALLVDVRTRRVSSPVWRQDFAYWLYIFGTTMFWCGLTLRGSDSELAKLGYAALNVGLVFIGAAIGRRVLTVFGALGVAIYLGDLSSRVFSDSLLFPFALTLLGFALVAAGVWWQRHEARITARLQRWVPPELRPRDARVAIG